MVPLLHWNKKHMRHTENNCQNRKRNSDYSNKYINMIGLNMLLKTQIPSNIIKQQDPTLCHRPTRDTPEFKGIILKVKEVDHTNSNHRRPRVTILISGILKDKKYYWKRF